MKPLALMACLTLTAQARNVFVLPTNVDVTQATPTGIVYAGTPLGQVASFTTGNDPFAVFAKPATNPAATKYYVIARSGSQTIQILNSVFSQTGSFNFGQQVTSAGLSPDGRRLLVFAGNLYIINTDTDTQVATQFIDVGPNANDIAFSHDSRRAFVASQSFQRVTAVDLVTNSGAGSFGIGAATRVSVSMAPNGLLYVGSDGKVFEVDPRVSIFNFNTAVRRSVDVIGTAGKLHFTPDGTRAITPNLTPSTGNTLFYFLSLDLNSPIQVSSVPTSALSSTSAVFEKMLVTSNTTAYALTTPLSSPSRALYKLTLPDAPVGGSSLGTPSLEENFFGGLGKIPIAETLSATAEAPSAAHMVIGSPLKILSSVADNTFYQINLTNNNKTDEVKLTQQGGVVAYAGPVASLDAGDLPATVLRYNATQPALPVSTTTVANKSLPLGVRVLTASGLPIYGQSVTMLPVSGGGTIDGSNTAFTNSEGFAFFTVIAPTTAGDFTFSVSFAGTSLSTSFTLSATTSGGGGGGGGGGGTPGVAKMEVFAGSGQVVRTGDVTTVPLTVRITDGSGKPIKDVSVNYKIDPFQGVLFRDGSSGTDENRSVTTDADGFAKMNFRALSSLGLGVIHMNTPVTVSSSYGTGTFQVVTYILVDANGNLAPPPLVEWLRPTFPTTFTGKVGETLTDAISVRVSSPSTGLSLPYVGISLSTGFLPENGPYATCTPDVAALSNSVGIATCSIKFGGKVGTATLTIDVGGVTQRTARLTINPGDPATMEIVAGNNLTGEPGAVVSTPQIILVKDALGNGIPSVPVRWEVIQGSATVQQTITVTTSNGQALNRVTLGTTPGTVRVRATAETGLRPAVEFTFTVNLVLKEVIKIAGDGQVTFTNTSFSQPLVVQVNDTQNRPVPGVTVNFNVNSGSATLSAASATTDATGRANVTVRAGSTPGSITVAASVANLNTVVFGLTANLPGPSIRPTDFFNTASGMGGGVVAGGIYTIVGFGIAPEVRGVVEANPILGPLPTKLADVEVTFGTTPAPIFNVTNANGRESVTVQAPFELAPNGEVPVLVKVSGGGSAVINGVRSFDLQPGLFETVDQRGRRYVVAIRPDGSYVTPENPARGGEIIRIYITGANQVLPVARTGVTGVPGQTIWAPVDAGINNAGVRVVSAHYAVGMVGVYEIQIEVPQGIAARSDAPVGVILRRPDLSPVFSNGSVMAVAP